MIEPKKFLKFLEKNNIDNFIGVPDSILKNFTNIIPSQKNITSCNEGSAISISSGVYLSTQKISLVYMQNSGLGNAINPLTSLTNKEVYDIPIVMLIGWRGHPSIVDEPQHRKMGNITLDILKLLDIEYYILDEKNYEVKLKNFLKKVYTSNSKLAILVKENTFNDSNNKLECQNKINGGVDLETSIERIIKTFNDSIYISSTGYISRILDKMEINYTNKFLVVGSMGYSSQISLGISNSIDNKIVVCFDGDGSNQMNMGGMATIGKYATSKLIHIIFNNGVHLSVGGQVISNNKIEYKKLSESLGYNNYFLIEKNEDFEKIKIDEIKYPALFEIKTSNKILNNELLKRPTKSCKHRKNDFTKNLLNLS